MSQCDMLTGEYIILVAIAFVISAPATFYFMWKWLDRFYYRTDSEIEVFLIAGIITLAVALLTVGRKTYAAICDNPINSIRNE